MFSNNAFAVSLGEQVIFNVDKTYDYYLRNQASATLKKIGEWGYFYIDDQWFDSLSSSQKDLVLTRVEQLSSDFDQEIYPKLTQNFGEIWSPGIDNDLKATILIMRLIDQAGGYFNPENEFSKAQIASSNEREMVQLNGGFLLQDLRRIKAFLAHEFQHLITFYHKEKLRNLAEDVWLNEMRSEYAPTFLGYDAPYSGGNLQKRVDVFLKYPSDSLAEWKNDQADYGPVALFAQYLFEHYGKEKLIQETLKSDKVGIVSVSLALKNLGYDVDFPQVFTDWTIANYLNNCAVKIEYCYQNPDLKNFRVQFNLIVGQGDQTSSAGSLKNWAATWYELAPGLNPDKTVLELKFSTASKDQRFKIPYIAHRKSGGPKVNFLDFQDGEGSVFVKDFGTNVNKVVIIPSLQTKTENFFDSEPSYIFDFRAKLLEKEPIIPSYSDGTLIRSQDDNKIYVVRGKYKRWIKDAAVLNFYGHLSPDKVVVVSLEEKDWYKDSRLIRQDGDAKVFEVWPNGTKHWLSMTAEEFIASGRSFEQVYIVNDKERNFYYTGSEIKS